MKTFKKIGAILLVAVLALTMSVVVFADDETAGGAVVNGTVTQDSETVSIKKEIVFINAEATTVREPNITYTYTLTAATGVTATVKDSTGLSATVKDGVAGAIATGTDTIVFKDTVTASATSAGTADVKYADLVFNEDVFTAPGIYRYIVTETCSPTKASVGVAENGTYNNVRYLDVYVQKKNASLSNAAGNMKIYGYVLYEDATGAEDVSFNGYTGEEQNLAKKSAGFDSASVGYDKYETENLYINKTTTGVLGDKGHDFPLSIAIAAPSGVTAPKLDASVSGNGALNSVLTDTVGNYLVLGTLTGTVRDGSQLVLKGLPVGSTLTVTETNDSPDSYKVKMESSLNGAAATTIYTEAIVAASATAVSSSVTASTKVELSITNTLDAISPTGFADRFTPFAILVVLGIGLVVMTRYFVVKNEKKISL